jgi:hypothetical protein
MVNTQQNNPAKEPRVKRSIVSMVVSGALVIAPLPAMSADTGPLPAAPAAGVKQAQGANDLNPQLLYLVGAGVVIGLGILILANNNNSNGVPLVPTPTPTPSTTTTTTTKAATTTTTTTGTTP